MIPSNLLKNKKIYIAGHRGMVGKSLVRFLKKKLIKKLILIDRKKLNLLNYNKVDNFIKKKSPDIIINCAGRVGGILANSKYPFNFLYENTTIQNNVIYACIKNKVKKVIFLGSSCIYPGNFKKPIKENNLMAKNLEKTNEAYAIAKISGLKLCESFNLQFNKSKTLFLTAIPPNLFGPNDNYDNYNSHVIAALLKKFYYAKKKNLKKIEIWGSGNPKREFMYSIDAAKIILKMLNLNRNKIKLLKKKRIFHINIGTGKDYKIKYLAKLIKKISNYKGKIKFNKKYPDGVKRKILNIDLQKELGLNINNNFESNLKKTYLSLNLNTFKKFEKNSTYNLPN